MGVHVLILLVPCIAGLSAWWHGAGMWGWIMAVLVSGPLLFFTVLVHEFGHVWAARRCGCVPDRILLWPLGGLAIVGGQISPKQQIFVSASGPGMHIPMFLLWAAVMAIVNEGHVTLSVDGLSYASLLCAAMLIDNLALLFFNLCVPCFPLDCSQILVSVMLLCSCEPNKTARVMVIISVLALLIILGCGIWFMWIGNPAAALSIFMALWLGVQTWKLHRARVQGRLADYPTFTLQPSSSQTPQPSSTMSFQHFEGERAVVGQPESTAQVCIGSLLVVMIAVFVANEVGPCHG